MSSETHSPEPTWADLMVLVERLDGGPYDEVAIDMPGLSVRMSRSGFSTVPAAIIPLATNPPAAAAAAANLPAAAAAAANLPAAVPAQAVMPAAAAARVAPTEITTAVESSPSGEITASILGVVYGRPAPDQDPFVAVGDTVEPTDTVAIVEVMKMMNQVEAGVSGRVSEILFTDGDLVEFGQPLFRVATAVAP